MHTYNLSTQEMEARRLSLSLAWATIVRVYYIIQKQNKEKEHVSEPGKPNEHTVPSFQASSYYLLRRSRPHRL